MVIVNIVIAIVVDIVVSVDAVMVTAAVYFNHTTVIIIAVIIIAMYAALRLRTFNQDCDISTFLFLDTLKRFVVRGTIFARMSPDQKQQLVWELQLLRRNVRRWRP